MKLTQQQCEKITLAIQAALGVLIIGLSIKDSARVQTAQMKKMAQKDAKQQNKLQKSEYRLKQKLMKQRYRSKIRQAKKSKGIFPS